VTDCDWGSWALGEILTGYGHKPGYYSHFLTDHTIHWYATLQYETTLCSRGY